jgi:hypothetical protein
MSQYRDIARILVKELHFAISLVKRIFCVKVCDNPFVLNDIYLKMLKWSEYYMHLLANLQFYSYIACGQYGERYICINSWHGIAILLRNFLSYHVYQFFHRYSSNIPILWHECILFLWSFDGLYTRMQTAAKNNEIINGDTRYCTL